MAEINRAQSVLAGNVGASLPKRRATSILGENVDAFVWSVSIKPWPGYYFVRRYSAPQGANCF